MPSVCARAAFRGTLAHMHSGEFIPTPSQPGLPGSQLEGAGSIEVGDTGIRIVGSTPHGLVMPLALVVGGLSTLTTLGIVVAFEDAAAGDEISGRGGAVLGIAGGLVGGFAAPMVLGRALPRVPVDRTVVRVTGLSLEGNVISFVVDDPAIGGRLIFRSPAAGLLHAALAMR